MARPVSRRRREEEEEEDDRGARGRRRGAAPAKGSNTTVVMGAVVGVLALVAIIAVAAGGKEKPRPAPAPLLGPPVEAPKAPPGSTEEPPKPLTAAEKDEIESAFREAEPHMEEFRAFRKEGFSKKEAGDNDGANESWLKAKKAYRAALGVVNEVMEDEDRFPMKRQEAFMKSWISKLSGWTHEFASVPKTFDK
jgi:hypothetical protein